MDLGKLRGGGFGVEEKLSLELNWSKRFLESVVGYTYRKWGH